MVGRQDKLNVDGSEVIASVGIGTLDSGVGLTVDLKVSVPASTVSRGKARGQGARGLPYSTPPGARFRSPSRSSEPATRKRSRRPAGGAEGSSSMARGIQAGDKAPTSSFHPDRRAGAAQRPTRRAQRGLVLLPQGRDQGGTAEACAFGDSYEVFAKAGAEVIGVSSDSVESAGFADHHKLPFTLVSDQGSAVRRATGSRRARRAARQGHGCDRLDRNRSARLQLDDQDRRHIDDALTVVKKLQDEQSAE